MMCKGAEKEIHFLTFSLGVTERNHHHHCHHAQERPPSPPPHTHTEEEEEEEKIQAGTAIISNQLNSSHRESAFLPAS